MVDEGIMNLREQQPVLGCNLGVLAERNQMSVILDSDTPLPCERTRRFPTSVDNQTTVCIEVCVGESSRAGRNLTIGMFEMHGIPAAPARQERIFLSYSVDVSKILTVTAESSNGNQ